MHHPVRPTWLVTALIALLVTACGGGGDSTAAPAASSPSSSSSSSSSSGGVTANSSSSSSSGGASGSTSSSSSSSSSSSGSSSGTGGASSSSGSSSSSSSGTGSSSSSSSSSGGTGGPASTTTGGFATTTGNIATARSFTATSYTEINTIIANARYNDAGKKVATGAYPLHIAYTGNEDALIAQIIADHTVDAAGNCPKPHWNDAYRYVEIKDFTAGVTIEGANGSSANWGIVINGSSNVAVRNMKIGALGGANNDADMIRIDSSSNVWIDHNELFAVNNECKGSPDGDLTFESAIDIKKDSHNITVSYNYIRDSKKVGLDGSSSSDIGGGREITFHHNYYSNVNGRLPLQRGGWIHAYNNLYDKITSSGINVRTGGLARIEANWFQNAVSPVTCRYDVVNCGRWELLNNNATSAADNATYNITWDTAEAGTINANTWTSTATATDSGVLASKISYAYTPDSALCVKNRLPSVVGVGKGYATLKCN